MVTSPSTKSTRAEKPSRYLVAVATSTIAAIEVDEIRLGGAVIDRKVVLVLDCQHRHFLSIRLDAALPKVGDPSSYRCLPCTVSDRLDRHEIGGAG